MRPLWLNSGRDIYQADLLGLYGSYQSSIIGPNTAPTPCHQVFPPPMMFRLLNHIINQPLGASQVLRARRACQAIILYGLRIDPFLRLRRLLFLIFRRRLRRVLEPPGLNYYFRWGLFLLNYHGGILWSLTILKNMR